MPATLESIGEELASNMPEPQEHAIKEEQEKASNEAASIVDRAGNPFNSEVHETDAQGAPRLNKDGTVKKKRGNKGGKKSSLVAEAPGIPSATKTGQAIADGIFSLGILIFGSDGQPIKNDEYGLDERSNMYGAWGRYCEAKDIKDFPPGVAVAMATIGYFLPRLFSEKAKPRFAKAKAWLSEKYLAFKNRNA